MLNGKCSKCIRPVPLCSWKQRSRGRVWDFSKCPPWATSPRIQNHLQSLKQADSWVSLDILYHTVWRVGLSTLHLGRSPGAFDVYLSVRTTGLVSEKRADFTLILLFPKKSTWRKQLGLELDHNN